MKKPLCVLLTAMSCALLSGCIDDVELASSGDSGQNASAPETGAAVGAGAIGVDAGADQYVSAGAAVTLDAQSDAFNASYRWEQVEGDPVALNGADSNSASFTTPVDPQTLKFVVTASDGQDGLATDEVVVMVLAASTNNAPPSAEAGADKSVEAGALVTLVGSGADSDGAVIGYQWVQTGGEAVALDGGDSQVARFVAPTNAQEMSFLLTVIDDAGDQASDELLVAVQPPAVAVSTSSPINPNSGESLPAFPGAEGFGALASGGRGGRVVKVTNLSASGEGSLQAALDLVEPRIVVFDVSGVIAGDIVLRHGDVTIAGQTAPGAGITLAGSFTTADEPGIDNIIVRHLRVRPDFNGGDGATQDAIRFTQSQRVILDHVSAAFGVDQTVDLAASRDVTVQWSTVEMSDTVGHPAGQHNQGLASGADASRLSLHHNLFAHHDSRAPALASGPAEVLNNVAYNVREGFAHHAAASGQFNIAGNYFRKGPDAALTPFYFNDASNGADSELGYFLAGNFVDDDASTCFGLVENPWAECATDLYLDDGYRADVEFDFSAVGQWWQPVLRHDASQAYSLVLAQAGALPRDVITRDSVQQTLERNGSWGAAIPADLLAGLTPAAAPVDSDGDGMADVWEQANGLDASDASDHAAPMASGYTAIEVYINQLADGLVAN